MDDDSLEYFPSTPFPQINQIPLLRRKVTHVLYQISGSCKLCSP